MPAKNQCELRLIIAILQNKFDLNKLTSDLSQINWDYLLELTMRHRVSEQIYSALKTVPEIPAEVVNKLKLSVRAIKLHLLQMTAEILRITRKLDAMQINYVIVKGIPLAIDVYGAADCRQCKDVDLWVDVADIEKCKEILLQLSYMQTCPVYPLTKFKEQYYFKNMHDIAFQHSTMNVEIELHFRLEYYGMKFWAINDVVTKEIITSGNKIITLGNEYNFLYLAIHAAIHAWSRLRWLHDIYLFLKTKDCSLVNVLRLAKELNAEHIIYQALWLVRDIYEFSNEEIDKVLVNIDKRSISLALTAKEFIQADYELTGGHGIYSWMFVKYRLYLFKLAIKGQKFNAVSGDLFKIEKMFSYVTLPDRFGFLYYLLYPFWVVKYIINRK